MDSYTIEELEAALKTIASVIHKIEKAKSHFAPGTPQHTLSTNRLKAFQMAVELITQKLKKSPQSD